MNPHHKCQTLGYLIFDGFEKSKNRLYYNINEVSH